MLEGQPEIQIATSQNPEICPAPFFQQTSQQKNPEGCRGSRKRGIESSALLLIRETWTYFRIPPLKAMSLVWVFCFLMYVAFAQLAVLNAAVLQGGWAARVVVSILPEPSTLRVGCRAA